jgi:hypothetical protein
VHETFRSVPNFAQTFTESSFDKTDNNLLWQTINVEHECYCVPAHTITNGMKVDLKITEAFKSSTALPTEKLQILHDTTLKVFSQSWSLTKRI